MTSEYVQNTSVIKTENLNLPDKFPFPYTPEDFADEEKVVLARFFTNGDRPVYVIKNLPQEVVGALFSRYSRTKESARRVFLDEFWKAPELGIQHITEYLVEEGKEEGITSARERAERFYKRVFAEYGDDSVIQMGSVHIAFENVSQIAAKAIEDQRIAAAYIEKSTRYVDFGNQVNGQYLYMEVPEIMSSDFAEEYLRWNDTLFEAYKRNIPTTSEHLKGKYPIEECEFESPSTGEIFKYADIKDGEDMKRVEGAYNRALKAKTLDTIRVFLPTTTITNLGAHFSGQSVENMLNKMLSSQYSEVRLLGAMAHHELMQVTPNFLQNVDHRYGVRTREYLQDTREVRDKEVAGQAYRIHERRRKAKVRLVDWDGDADVKIAAQLIYTGQQDRGMSKQEIFDWARRIKEEDKLKYPELAYSPRLAEIITKAVPDRSAQGLNRRHKPPRAFEHAYAEVEFFTDFGIYRDLQRNRMSSTERQMLTPEDLFVPSEFYDTGMEGVLAEYLNLAEETWKLNGRIINKGGDLVDASEYVTMFGSRLRYNIRANIRQWAFFSELRTIEGGHPSYRRALQSAAKQILTVYPFLEPHFAHVNWTRDYGLGRLKAEVRTQDKLSGLEK